MVLPVRTDFPVEAPDALTCLVVLPAVVDLPRFLPVVEVCFVVLPGSSGARFAHLLACAAVGFASGGGCKNLWGGKK